METEIRFQPRDLANHILHRPRTECIFVGAGDSYAAALAVQMVSRTQALSCHPLDLIDTPTIARGKNVYLISISGRTSANVKAAKAVRKFARRIIAVTATPHSPLAVICDGLINLEYRSSGVTTSGTNSFTASLITCLSLAKQISLPREAGPLLRRAERHARIFADRMVSVNGAFYVLGDGILFPIALYGSLKLNEVLGAKAFAYPAEEFGHSPIFSARMNDGIIILGRDTDSSAILEQKLKTERLNVARISAPGQSEIDAILYTTFFVQMFAVSIARQRGIKDCYFLKKKSLLEASSDLIY